MDVGLLWYISAMKTFRTGDLVMGARGSLFGCTVKSELGVGWVDGTKISTGLLASARIKRIKLMFVGSLLPSTGEL